MPSVVRLSVAPVKSTALVHPDTIRLHAWGAEGNRTFYFARPDGRLVTDRHHGPLVRLRARHEADREELTIDFPDGAQARGDATALGRPVRTDFFGREVSGRVLEGDWTDALTAYAGFEVDLVRPDLPGDGNDGYPVSLFGTASAEELARRSGRREALDSRRFRMLIEVTGTSPHQEDTWIGRQVRVGEAVVTVTKAVERCVITTLDPSTGVKDLDTLAAIAAYRGRGEDGGIEFGIYAAVVEPGSITVGDAVRPL